MAEVILDQVTEESVTTGDTIEVECEDCGISTPEQPLQRVIEHAAFDHVTRRGLTLVRRSRLLSGYELSESLDLPAQTAHEEKWRARRDALAKPIEWGISVPTAPNTTDTNH